MKAITRYIKALIPGAVLGAAAAFLSGMLMRNLSAPAAAAGRLFGADDVTVQYISRVLGQLRGAEIAVPWAACIICGAAIGLPVMLRVRRIWVRVVLLGVLLVLGTVAAACFTEVNGILTFALLRRLIPAAAALL